MKTITKKIALYDTEWGKNIVFEVEGDCLNHIRVSNLVDVEFILIPERQTQAKVAAIEAKKLNLQLAIDELERKKTELIGVANEHA